MASSLRRTALFDLHKELGGSMVTFAGYSLPVQYRGPVHEITATRTRAGLFDVGHMGQIRLVGADAPSVVKLLTPVNYDGLADGQSALSMFLSPTAGILDDCIVTRGTREVSIVINASRVEDDIKHVDGAVADARAKGRDVALVHDDGRALLALQGPSAVGVLSHLVGDLSGLSFMHREERAVDNIGPVVVTRCGYTGEDGFEISLPNERAVDFARALLKHEEVTPNGLAARDVLRLEAGMCLYGSDLSENIDPVSARLMWCVAKDRLAEGSFIGAEALRRIMADRDGPGRRVRIGATSTGPIPRKDAMIYAGGAPVGVVTSGGFSPSLRKNIAMAYVEEAAVKAKAPLVAKVRSSTVDLETTPLPFIPSKYHKLPPTPARK